MLKFKLSFLLLLVFWIFQTEVLCKESAQNNAIGLNISFGVNDHKVKFTKLPDVPNCCPIFDGGNGLSGQFSFFWDTPVYEKLMFRTELGLEYINAHFDSDEMIKINDDKSDALVRHSLNIYSSTADLSIGAIYNVYDNLKVKAMLKGGLPMTKRFNQIETLIEPDYGSFENGSRTRNYQKGEMQRINSILFYASFGISWDFTLFNNNIILSPTFDYNIGLNSFIKDYNWQINNFYIGFSVKYNFIEAKKKDLEKTEPDATKPEQLN